MEKQKNTSKKTRWLVLSILGVFLVGGGLSFLGEAIIAKTLNKAWFLTGTLSLVLVNSGICLIVKASEIDSKN